MGVTSLFCQKKDGSYRFCIDYRLVNAVSKRDVLPIPDIHDALDHLTGLSTSLHSIILVAIGS